MQHAIELCRPSHVLHDDFDLHSFVVWPEFKQLKHNLAVNTMFFRSWMLRFLNLSQLKTLRFSEQAGHLSVDIL